MRGRNPWGVREAEHVHYETNPHHCLSVFLNPYSYHQPLAEVVKSDGSMGNVGTLQRRCSLTSKIRHPKGARFLKRKLFMGISLNGLSLHFGI